MAILLSFYANEDTHAKFEELRTEYSGGKIPVGKSALIRYLIEDAYARLESERKERIRNQISDPAHPGVSGDAFTYQSTNGQTGVVPDVGAFPVDDPFHTP